MVASGVLNRAVLKPPLVEEGIWRLYA